MPRRLMSKEKKLSDAEIASITTPLSIGAIAMKSGQGEDGFCPLAKMKGGDNE